MKLSERLKVGQVISPQTVDLYLGDKQHTDEWRDEAIEFYDFVAGRQWSEKDVAALKKQKRPVVVFNRTKTVIDAVSGNEIGNRRTVRYIPRELGDVKANELYTGAGEWFRDRSHAEDAETDSFADMLITGMGWTETRIDFDNNPAGDPVIDRLDPLEMVWDRHAKKRNLADARRLWRVRRVPYSEAKMLVEDEFSQNDMDADWTELSSASDYGYSNNHADEEDSADRDPDVTLVHIQWTERQSYMLAIDPMTGEQAEFTPEEFGTLNQRLKAMTGMEVPGQKATKMVRMQALIGRVVLMVSEAPSQKGFSWNAITGYRDRNKNLWFGMVRSMRDPQQWSNKWLSQQMHILNTNAKGGIMVEKGAVENMAQFERTWSDPSKPTVLKDGAIAQGRIQEKTSATFPAGFQQLTEFGVSSIRDVTGVSLEVLGMREANQAASLEYQRRQSGMMILQPLFDGLKLYREIQGAVMLDYIQNDLSDGRLIRINGEDTEQYVRLLHQADAEYDIIVDDAPTSPNHKELVWQMFMQLLPVLGKTLPPPVMLAMLEYSPLPSEVVEKMRNMLSQPPSPEQQMQEQIAMRGAAAEVAKAESEAEENLANVQKMQAETAETQADTVQTLADVERTRLAEAIMGVPVV